MVLKGGVSSKNARFLLVFCPYRGIYRRFCDTVNSTHHSIQHSIHRKILHNFWNERWMALPTNQCAKRQ